MINLLPEEEKKQLRAARTNVLLLRYSVVMICAGAFLALIFAGSYFLLEQNRATAQRLIELNESDAAAYTAARAEVDALSANLADATTILGSEVPASKLLVAVAQLMPAGTVINSLTLENATIGTPVQVQVYATSTNATSTLQRNFQSSPLFSSVSFLPSNSGESIDGYPVAGTLTFTLNGAIE